MYKSTNTLKYTPNKNMKTVKAMNLQSTTGNVVATKMHINSVGVERHIARRVTAHHGRSTEKSSHDKSSSLQFQHLHSLHGRSTKNKTKTTVQHSANLGWSGATRLPFFVSYELLEVLEVRLFFLFRLLAPHGFSSKCAMRLHFLLNLAAQTAHL